MAANIQFGNEELPVQDVVDLLAKEIKRLKGNYSDLNETLKQVEVRQLSDTLPNANTSAEEVNLHLSNPVSLARPNFDLVSVIPTFNGDERDSVSDFISKIEDVGTLSGWSDANKIVVAKLKLKGTAFSFSKSDEACQSAQNLTDLQHALEGRFKEKLPDHYYFEQLANIRQERGETIEKYSDRVKHLSIKTIRCTHNAEVDKVLREEGDRRAMEAFTRGLFGELGKQVRIRFPKTLQEAVTLAIAIRDVERKPSHESFSKPVFLTPSHQEVRCHKCNKLGHKQNDCRVGNRTTVPVNKQYRGAFQHSQDPRSFHNSQPSKQCNFCKRLGHWESECRTKVRQMSQDRTRQSHMQFPVGVNNMEQPCVPPHNNNNNRNGFVPRRTFGQQNFTFGTPTNQPVQPPSNPENFQGSPSTASGATRKQN